MDPQTQCIPLSSLKNRFLLLKNLEQLASSSQRRLPATFHIKSHSISTACRPLRINHPRNSSTVHAQPLLTSSPAKMLPYINLRRIPARDSQSPSNPPLLKLVSLERKLPKCSQSSRSSSARTKTGAVLGQTKDFNQDSFIICTFGKQKNDVFGVFDGHGAKGHVVSEFLRENLPLNIEKSLSSSTTIAGLSQAFSFTSSTLLSAHSNDVQFSGSTANIVVLQENTCTCANVGDSRAVLGNFSNKQWTCRELSQDHKPTNPIELARIRKLGGRVEPCRTPGRAYIGPHRVWLADQQFPGLAMSRAFGDQVASYVGVIAVPEYFSVSLSASDKLLILATDGVWEVMSSAECVEFTGELYSAGVTAECAAEELLKEVTSRWGSRASNRDDITVIVVFLERNQ